MIEFIGSVIHYLTHSIESVINNPSYLVFWNGLLATFLASVMVREQSDRLKQGTFGAIAGTGVGAFAALYSKDESLLLIGLFGSACGALAAFVFYLLIALVAGSKKGRAFVDYLLGGLEAVRNQLDLDRRERMSEAFGKWAINFNQMVSKDKAGFIVQPKGAHRNHWIIVVLTNWLVSVNNMFNFVFDVLAKENKYRTRATIIVFRMKPEPAIGKHWISHSGALPRHKNKPFDTASIAYKVISGDLESPYFTTVKNANAQAQNRESQHANGPLTGDGHAAEGKRHQEYVSFFVFRLNDTTALSVDWPTDVKENDPYVVVARDLLSQVTPSMTEILDLWDGNLEEGCGLGLSRAGSDLDSSPVGREGVSDQLQPPPPGTPPS